MKTVSNQTFKLPEHFMVSSTDGHLYDTRKPDWFKTPVRLNYQAGHREINTTSDLKACLRERFAWPGGYEFVYLTFDGGFLCHNCVIQNLTSVLWSIKNEVSDGWQVIALTLDNELDSDFRSECSHCNRKFDC